jgi:transcriptional regulator with XRE-family HTH domain
MDGEDETATQRRSMLILVGRRIVRLREKRRWTQADLAQRLGLKRERVSHWERGEHSPTLAALVALARTFRISLDELVLGETRLGVRLTEDEKREAERHVAALSRLLIGDVAARGFDEHRSTLSGAMKVRNI